MLSLLDGCVRTLRAWRQPARRLDLKQPFLSERGSFSTPYINKPSHGLNVDVLVRRPIVHPFLGHVDSDRGASYTYVTMHSIITMLGTRCESSSSRNLPMAWTFKC